MTHWKLFAVLVAGLVAVACGSADVSTQDVTETQASLQAAEKMGAEQEPQASLYLTYAREQADMAQELIEEDENTRATMMLKRAQADAELAMSLAREADMRRQVSGTMERIQALQANVTAE